MHSGAYSRVSRVARGALETSRLLRILTVAQKRYDLEQNKLRFVSLCAMLVTGVLKEIFLSFTIKGKV